MGRSGSSRVFFLKRLGCWVRPEILPVVRVSYGFIQRVCRGSESA